MLATLQSLHRLAVDLLNGLDGVTFHPGNAPDRKAELARARLKDPETKPLLDALAKSTRDELASPRWPGSRRG